MAKLKNRTKRKAVNQKQSNQASQHERDAGEFVKLFSGFMQVSLKEETDDETIIKNVKRCADWLKNNYQIFKHDCRFYVEVILFKTDPAIKPAIMGMETDVIEREYVSGMADVIIDELKKEHDDINFDKSYTRIYV
ncbi:MAG: hypothetical protein L0G25_03805 [Psychrobacter sp.]|nr:hypothetical protein [Psychrobacter sp.]